MLGFVGPGFVKSLKVICRNCYRSVENAEKNFKRKEKAACERACVGIRNASEQKLHKY